MAFVAMLMLGMLVGVALAILARAVRMPGSIGARLPLVLVAGAVLAFTAYLAFVVLDVGALVRG